MIPPVFTDRDLGKAFPRILRTAGLRVHAYGEVYERDDVPDEQWIIRCGREGWLALTHDKSIPYTRRSPAPMNAILAQGVRLIILRGHRKTAELAECLLASLPQLETFLVAHPPPFIAKFYCSDETSDSGERRPGRIELKYGATDA